MDTAIITGTTRGLGKALEAQFAAENWQTIPLNRPIFDLSTFDADMLASQFLSIQTSGRIVLVNSAATHHIEPIRTLSAVRIAEELSTNVAGPISLICTFLRSFPGGEVANITSVAASNAYVNWSLYGTAKAAMNAFIGQLGAEGVKCFNLNPGAVATDMQVAISKSTSPLPDGVVLRDVSTVAKNLVWQISRG